MTELLAQTSTLLPGQRSESYTVTTREVAGLRNEAHVRQHLIIIDESAGWGTDLAANPAELLLAALGSSIAITYRLYAGVLAVPLVAISVTLRSSLDLLGFLDAQADASVGFDVIDVAIELILEDGFDPSSLEALNSKVGRCCRLLDTLRRAVDVKLSVSVVTSSRS